MFRGCFGGCLGGCLGVFRSDLCGVLEGFRGQKRIRNIKEKHINKIIIFV